VDVALKKEKKGTLGFFWFILLPLVRGLWAPKLLVSVSAAASSQTTEQFSVEHFSKL